MEDDRSTTHVHRFIPKLLSVFNTVAGVTQGLSSQNMLDNSTIESFQGRKYATGWDYQILI